MLDRYQYLEKLYLRTHSSSIDAVESWRESHSADSSRRRSRPIRKSRVHHSRTQTGTSSEALLLTVGVLSGLSAFALAAYHLVF